jgi:omega-6 fatty acid desaturase (delta-12 desaturase)
VFVTVTEPAIADRPGTDADETGGGREGSLKPVLDIIPAEAYENPTSRGFFYFGRDMAMYLLVVAGLIAFANPLIVIPLEIVAALVVSALFVVAHDAAHGALFSSKRLNSIVGHIAMLPSWHVYEGWVLGHNRIHHGYTVRQGFDFVWHPYTPQEFAAMGLLTRLRHRLEWSWAGAGAYYIREVWWNKMVVGKPPARWVSRIRRDRFIVLAYALVTSAALIAFGWVQTDGSVVGIVWLWARVLLIPFVTFSFVIGSFVHVHHVQPEIIWWKRREWTKFRGQMEGTTILRAPWGSNFFFHWIMVHIPHHVDMRIPMYNLELAADAIKAAYPETVHDEPMRFRDFVRNTKQCKLYDFDAHEWLTYEQGTARLAQSATTTAEPVPA